MVKKAVVGKLQNTFMKRLGNLIPLICTKENIEHSIKVVLRGNKRKKTRAARYILSHKDEVIQQTLHSIESGTFKIGKYKQCIIREGTKNREIQIINYRDRITVNAIMTILDQFLVKRLIYTTASSIKGRGTIYLKDIIQRDLRCNPDLKYYYKIDINKYYHSIDHNLMKSCIRRYIKDKTLLPILDNFVDMLDTGLSIGLRASQIFGNLYLGWLLDMPMKCQYRTKFYYRYCDDIVILSTNKKDLWKQHQRIQSLLLGTGLSIKDNYKVSPISNGLDYLGYVIYDGTSSKVRKRIKNNAKKKLSHIKSKNRRQEVVASIKGYCLHCNGYNLFKALVTHGNKNTRRR